MQKDRHMLNVSGVVSLSPLMITIAHGLLHFNIRLHSTSINCYAQRSEVPSLIEDFGNQTAYVSILTDVCSFIMLLLGKSGTFDYKPHASEFDFIDKRDVQFQVSTKFVVDTSCFPHKPPAWSLQFKIMYLMLHLL